MKRSTQRLQSNHLASASLACLLALSGTAMAQPSQSSDFDLVCYGTGEKLEGKTDYDWDSKHHEYREHSSLGTAQIGGTAQVEIHGGEGRIRLPKSLLPPLTTGGSAGWFPIRNLSVTSDRITGSLKINGLNKPGLTINRRTGRLQIDGLESFDGTCNAFNPGDTRF